MRAGGGQILDGERVCGTPTRIIGASQLKKWPPRVKEKY